MWADLLLAPSECGVDAEWTEWRGDVTSKLLRLQKSKRLSRIAALLLLSTDTSVVES